MTINQPATENRKSFMICDRSTEFSISKKISDGNMAAAAWVTETLKNTNSQRKFL